jgi:hypothetical protein
MAAGVLLLNRLVQNWPFIQSLPNLIPLSRYSFFTYRKPPEHPGQRSSRSSVALAPTGWTAFDAVRYEIEMAEDVTMVLQERAYTSPIWYTPE